MCCIHQTNIIHVRTDNDTRRIKVIVQCLALSQKFRTEDDIVAVELFTNSSRIANWDRGLNHHNSFWVVLDNQLDNCFNCTCVEKVLLAIVICRSSDYYKISIRVCFPRVQSRGQIQSFFCQVFFNVFVLNRRLLVINQFHFLWNNVHSSHLVVLR